MAMVGLGEVELKLAGPDQEKLIPPVACNSIVSPTQNEPVLVAPTIGAGLTVTVVETAAVQPLKSVTVTI